MKTCAPSGTRPMDKMMKYFLAASAAMLLANCSASGGPARPGAPAPGFTARTSSGAELSLSSYRGKAVYLNFFATWCPPCNAEAPEINALQKKYASRGLQVIGVDELEGASSARRFVQKYGLVYPAVVDDNGALGTPYLVNGLPVHVFITRAGIVKNIVVGEMSAAQIERSIRAALAS